MKGALALALTLLAGALLSGCLDDAKCEVHDCLASSAFGQARFEGGFNGTAVSSELEAHSLENWGSSFLWWRFGNETTHVELLLEPRDEGSPFARPGGNWTLNATYQGDSERFVGRSVAQAHADAEAERFRPWFLGLVEGLSAAVGRGPVAEPLVEGRVSS